MLSTPNKTPTRPLLQSQSSASITSEKDKLLRNSPAINETPIKKPLLDVTASLESERSEPTVSNIGTHNLTGGTVLERLREIEAAAGKRKRKKKGGGEGRKDSTEGGSTAGMLEVPEGNQGSNTVRLIILQV
ncbi:hypothetical protein TREMEDRAFT_70521 [Tremella mesenterica DSM 1558]|uniref:uncharacterized protein n=1 Tax=Tremella mesenterica (strain ATCC 24925 / CBS 8224 / DSM 1558 / NBRC 9311 / NRRL Y-6157 / RJB 2259-6 / UBC 559-6) TaxID=578456 RepID=UPI00032CDDF4|nr:uncharacterized protein TREMEDRAFT_70521 [Tremella mesenterica DSM 1558]EIW65600.1 hypothetical protein TREMEDRAFT_70521 [Tremella mesenterica DSM 1558]